MSVTDVFVSIHFERFTDELGDEVGLYLDRTGVVMVCYSAGEYSIFPNDLDPYIAALQRIRDVRASGEQP